MMKQRNDLQISYPISLTSAGDNLEKQVRVKKIDKLVIILFPFITFFGPFIKISIINFSNIYSLILCFFVFNNLLKRSYINIKGYVIFFCVMMFYAVASLIWGDYSFIGIGIILPLLTGLIAMLYLAAFNESELNLFLKAFSVLTIIIIIMAIFEIFTGEYLFFNNLDFIYRMNPYGLRYPGVVFTNTSDLSQYLLVGFPLLVFVYFEKKRRFFLSVLLFLATVFVILNTVSRLSFISVVIIVTFYLGLSKINKENKFLKIFMAICISVMLINVLTYFGTDFFDFDVTKDILSVGIATHYEGREVIYNNIFNLGVDNFLLGAGLGGSYSESIIGPHNLFLFIFADLGIVFAVGLSIILLTAFVFLYKYRNVELCGCHLALIVLSIFVIFPMFSCISSGNEQRKIVWIALGLVFAVINNCRIKTSLKRL